MEVYECIRTRRTWRDFKPDPVPEPLIRKILRAGRWSPQFHQLPTLALHRRHPTRTPSPGWAKSPPKAPSSPPRPLVIAIAMENALRPHLDAGRAIQQMELTAWDAGLGTCFVGLRAEEQQVAIKELLGIPPELELITLLPFGYRAARPASRVSTPRKPLAEIAHRERFGVPYTANPA